MNRIIQGRSVKRFVHFGHFGRSLLPEPAIALYGIDPVSRAIRVSPFTRSLTFRVQFRLNSGNHVTYLEIYWPTVAPGYGVAVGPHPWEGWGMSRYDPYSINVTIKCNKNCLAPFRRQAVAADVLA